MIFNSRSPWRLMACWFEPNSNSAIFIKLRWQQPRPSLLEQLNVYREEKERVSIICRVKEEKNT